MAELLDADTCKAAQKERDRRMREINTANEIQVRTETASKDVPTFKQFSEALWKVYLSNQRINPSTVATYSCVLENHLLPVFGACRLDEIRPADLSVFFERLNAMVYTQVMDHPLRLAVERISSELFTERSKLFTHAGMVN